MVTFDDSTALSNEHLFAQHNHKLSMPVSCGVTLSSGTAPSRNHHYLPTTTHFTVLEKPAKGGAFERPVIQPRRRGTPPKPAQTKRSPTLAGR